jgi:hypothetical protein
MRWTRVARCALSLSLAPALLTQGLADAVEHKSAQGATVTPPRNGAASSRAPSSPPLAPAAGGDEGIGGTEDAGVTPQGEADPLVSNGLGSPSCKGGPSIELSLSDRFHCETSGFVAAPAPTGNYGIDVHIDTGLTGFNSGGLFTAVQDVFVTPLWMAMVWSVHALVVMLEWGFTVDLLDSAAVGGLTRGLRQAQVALTNPWLPLALAVASVLALYQGLIRRRVAATVGEALLMATMMAGGLWVIADPTGTVGAVGQWANQAALGTLAVAARGTPSTPGHVLGESLDAVFAAAIEAPWCYLEFGDVEWCRDPARLDSGLRKAGLAIASQEALQSGCKEDACRSSGGSAHALEHSAELLREAHSNGAIFLALPANGPARNSINDSGSLLRTICRSSEATNCQGPTAAQAQFRTAGQTWARVGGVLLIAAGLLGMLLLLGFIAVRLLGAAIFSLLYLLLAPAMVLAPAFGEGGRALFRKWGAQLLSAVVSKLMFSFLLGVVLALLTILSDLSAIGWWTQWLLMSTFWWGAYARRHQALGIVGGALGGERTPRRSVVRRMSDALETRKAIAAVRWAKEKYTRTAPNVEERHSSKPRRSRARDAQRESSGVDEQVTRTLRHEHADASGRASAGEDLEQQISSMRGDLERVRLERAKALAAGDRRRTVKLGNRSERIEGEIDRQQDALDLARRVSGMDSAAYVRERHGDQERFLDAQALLPASSARGRGAGSGSERRDYPRLAGLASYPQAEYERLDPRAQRAARLQIDRELALRKELARSRGEGAKPVASVTDAANRRREPNMVRWVAPSHGGPGGEYVLIRQPPVRVPALIRDLRECAAGRKREFGLDKD